MSVQGNNVSISSEVIQHTERVQSNIGQEPSVIAVRSNSFGLLS